MKYDKNTFTFGAELEWGDIPRDTIIPDELGSWEKSALNDGRLYSGCECDIVNLIGENRGKAVNPNGILPGSDEPIPVGGEINTKPTLGWEQQFENIKKIRDLFKHPTASVINHGHIHVSVSGLKDDIEGLKKLTRYIKENQELTIEKCYQFKETPDMQGDKSKTYLKWDGGRLMPDWMCDNIDSMTNTFDDFIRIQSCGKDGVSRGRPFRYGINTYCMKHTGTIEFRCLRASVEDRHIHDSLKFVERFIECALNDGPPVSEIFEEYDYQFPPFIYDREMSLAWKETKHESDPKKKTRKRYEVGESGISEEPVEKKSSSLNLLMQSLKEDRK